MAVTGLNHVGLSTPDLDRALAFYRDGLGFPQLVAYAWPVGNAAADAGLGVEGTAASLTVLHAGNAYLEVLAFDSPTPQRYDEPPTLRREGITHLGLEVHDLEDATAHLVEHGARRLPPEHDAPSDRTRLLRDPDGNLLELRVTGDDDALCFETLAVSIPAVPEADGPTLPSHDAASSPVLGISHVGIATLGADPLHAFYTDAGLRTTHDVTWDLGGDEPADATRRVSQAGRALVMDAGNAYLELLEYHDVPVAPRPADARIIDLGFNHVCFDVDDIAGTHAHLLARGMTCFAGWTPMPGGHSAMGYAMDPAGTPIELLEHRTTASTMFPGRLATATRVTAAGRPRA